MIDRFEVEHWYRWTGPKKRRNDWERQNGDMDFILDGLPHKVQYCGSQKNVADFEGNERKGGFFWNWSDGFEYFEECSAPYLVDKHIMCRCTPWEVLLMAEKKTKHHHSRRKTILSRLSIE